MPFSDPLCAQYSLSVIKNCHAATGVFFVLSDGQKEKSSSTNLLYQTSPRLSIRCPPFAGDPRPLFASPPRSREPHIRESHTFARAPVRESHTFARDLRHSCLFWWRAIPPSVTRRVRPRDNSDPQARKNRPPSLPKSIPKAPKSPPTSPKSPPTSHIPKMYRKSPKKPHNFR